MATKFTTHADAVAAARAHNIRINGGGNGDGYIIESVKGIYSGWDFIPGYYVACAKVQAGHHRVSPI
jgi:hypothetical protein